MATKIQLQESYEETKSFTKTAKIFGISRQRVYQVLTGYYTKYNNEYIKRKTKEYKELAIKRLGGKCNTCGFSNIKALQIDHVKGGGNKEIKAWAGNRRRYYKIVYEDTTGKYQLLCANCNWIKKYNNNEVGSRNSDIV